MIRGLQARIDGLPLPPRGFEAGEVLVHRNIANMVSEKDTNCMSALEFAVEHLGAGHLVACGRYGCGEVVVAALQKEEDRVVDWLRELCKLAPVQKALPGEKHEQDLDHLSELNLEAFFAQVPYL